MNTDQNKIPKWLWISQIILFRGLGTMIAAYEVTADISRFRWEGLLFAGWLFLIPDAVRGRDTLLFKVLGQKDEKQ